MYGAMSAPDEKQRLLGRVDGNEEAESLETGVDIAFNVEVNERNTNGSSKWGKAALLLVILATLGSLLFASTNNGNTNSKNDVSLYTSSSSRLFNTLNIPLSTYDVVLSISNEYGSTDRQSASSSMQYAGLKNRYFMEPYKTHNVEVTLDTSTFSTHSSCVTSYVITDMTGDGDYQGTITNLAVNRAGTSLMGSASIKPTSPGFYDITFSQECSTTSVSASTVPLMIKYVHRDLFKLTEADRERFLDAFAILWTTSTVEGQKKYGSSYKSIWYFVQIHIDASMVPDGTYDEFHGGSGFLSDHILLSMYMEQSLHAVDPAATFCYLPYLEFFNSDMWTAHMNDPTDGGTYTDLFTSKWFGSSDPLTGKIIDGRWSGLKVQKANTAFYQEQGIDTTKSFWTDDVSENQYYGYHATNAFGYQTYQWSFKGDQDVLRLHNVAQLSTLNNIDEQMRDYSGVQCSKLEWFITNYVIDGNYADFSSQSQGGLHGPAHFSIAGQVRDIDVTLVDEWRALEKNGIKPFDDNGLAVLFWNVHHQMKDGIQSTFANTTAQAWFTCSNFPIYTHSVDQLSRMDFSGVEYNDGSAYAVTCAYEYPSYLPTVAVADEAKQALLEYFDTTITTDDSFWTTFNTYLNSLTTAETEAVVDLYIRTFVPEGDLSTQNAPIDPTFWVMHAEVLRLYHAGIINGLLTDTSFTDASVDIQGHNAGKYQQWLDGLYLADGTNAVDFNLGELTGFLDPTSTDYHEKLDFIIDSNSFSGCPTANAYLNGTATYTKTKTTSTSATGVKRTAVRGGM